MRPIHRDILIQQASGEFHERILEMTRPFHKRYCESMGLDYWTLFGSVVPDRSPHWNKLGLIQAAIEQGRRKIIWLDADCLIVDQLVNIIEGVPKEGCIGMVVHRRFEPVHFNSGAIYIESTWDSYQFLKAVWHAYDPMNLFPWKDQSHWNDQQVFMRLNDSLSVIKEIHDRWNSCDINPTEKPAVVSLHGMAGMDKVQAMKKLMKKWGMGK